MRHFLLLCLLLFLSSCSVTRTSNDFIFPTVEGKAQYIAAYDLTLQSLWGIPFVEENVPTTFGLAHVIISGPKEGEPIVLFHGTDASSTMWYPNIKALSKNHRVYAIDYPVEAGKSLMNLPDLNNKQMVQFYNEIFDWYKLQNINFVAASRGGWIATYLALQPDNRVKKLLLLSPAQTFGFVDKKGKALSAMVLKMFPDRAKLAIFFDRFSYYPEKIDKKYKEQFYLANKYGKSKPGLTKMLQFKEKDLAGLTIPVLVLVGDHDVINNVKILDKAKTLLPHSETAIIKNAGHFISIDQYEIVNQKLVDFLNKN